MYIRKVTTTAQLCDAADAAGTAARWQAVLTMWLNEHLSRLMHARATDIDTAMCAAGLTAARRVCSKFLRTVNGFTMRTIAGNTSSCRCEVERAR